MGGLIPGRIRAWVPALLAGTAVLFVLAAASVWHGHRALAFDRSVQHALGIPDWSQRTNQHLGDLAAGIGGGLVIALGSVALAVAVYLRRGYDWAALALTAIALPAGLAVDWVVKPIVGRRYYGSGYRFPSGHAATVTTLVVVGWLILGSAGRGVHSRATVFWVAVAGLTVIGIVSWGLLVTRAHSPIDILGGWLFGGGVALAGATAIDAVARERAPAEEAR
jgi:membrane-associated phospholipid phosphatase